MKKPFYYKYKSVLEKYGYSVEADGTVVDKDGNRAAAEDRFGNVSCADINVTMICREAEMEINNPSNTPKDKKRIARAS